MSAAPPTLRTRQLLLRAPRAEDVDALHAIQGDREAMTHSWWAPDRQATQERLGAYVARHAEDGFSPWTAVLADGGEVVGWGGLNVDPFEPGWGPEVAYFFHPSHWGKGLATELVAAALDLAFGPLALARVAAFARPDNGASRRVLEKNGFRRLRYLSELERDHFSVREEDFRRCRS